MAEPVSREMLDAYLQRVGIDPNTDLSPDLETLRRVVGAHVRSIAFEALDPLTGVAVHQFDPSPLMAKMVYRRRGGYCFEQNGLMAIVLDRLGYDVQRLAGRVVWQREPGPLPAETHQLLAVGIGGDDRTHLVDVGFGGLTPPGPLLLHLDDPQATDLESYRIVRAQAPEPVAPAPTHPPLTMQALVAGSWESLYHFSPTPRPPIDSVVGSWFVSTHPTSRFVTTLIATTIADEGRLNLRGRHLSEYPRSGPARKTVLGSASEVLGILVDRFGIEVSDIVGLEERIDEVLDV